MTDRIPIEDLLPDRVAALRGMATTRRAFIAQSVTEDERQTHERVLAEYERRILRGY